MKILAQSPDVEQAVVDYLTLALAARAQTCTVGVAVPSTWQAGSTPFVQVMLAGTPTVKYPILAHASVQVTCWATNTSTAKALALLCEGLLLSYMGDHRIAQIRSISGLLATRDSATQAQLAGIVVRVTARYQPLP